MDWPAIGILLLVAVWAVLAVRGAKKKKGGCGCGCSGCPGCGERDGTRKR